MSIDYTIISKLFPERLTKLISHFREHLTQTTRYARLQDENMRKIETLLGSSSPIKLEFGAGENRNIPGWTYADFNGYCDITLDLTQSLPFPDNCVTMIYSCHLLEHFRYPDLIKLLNECRRILMPGGIFSAAVPNARLYLEAYHNPECFNPVLFCRHEPAYDYNSKIDYINYMAYMDGHHKYMFDEENLVAILMKSGFKAVRLREFDGDIDSEVRHFQTIYVECVK